MTSLAKIRAVLEENLGEPACGICGSTDRVVVDHDHETGLVRGWLCPRCNMLEGRRAPSPSFDAWRAEPPAAGLGLIHPTWRPPDVWSRPCPCCGLCYDQRPWTLDGPPPEPVHECPGYVGYADPDITHHWLAYSDLRRQAVDVGPLIREWLYSAPPQFKKLFEELEGLHPIPLMKISIRREALPHIHDGNSDHGFGCLPPTNGPDFLWGEIVDG